jgi:pyrroloquinoline quinone biosynthesis protein E
MTGELTCEEWLQIIREAGELGVLTVTFSGGEPLIRPDLPMLINEASSVGIYPVLSTNASLISRNTARELACAGLRFAHVSFCAGDAEAYGRMTGSHNKFAAALNGLRHLKGQDIYVRLKTVLMPGNLDQIHGVLDLAMKEGVDEVHLAPYRMTHLSPGGSSLLLRRNDFWQIEADVDLWKRRTNSTMPIRIPNPEKEKLAWNGAGEIVRCGGIKAEMTVLPDGRITLCEVLRDRPEFIVGHALHDGILGAWLSRRPEEVLEGMIDKAEEPCRSCAHLSGCRTGCFSLSMACGGSPWSADPRCWKSNYSGNPFVGL